MSEEKKDVTHHVLSNHSRKCLDSSLSKFFGRGFTNTRTIFNVVSSFRSASRWCWRERKYMEVLVKRTCWCRSRIGPSVHCCILILKRRICTCSCLLNDFFLFECCWIFGYDIFLKKDLWILRLNHETLFFNVRAYTHIHQHINTYTLRTKMK